MGGNPRGQHEPHRGIVASPQLLLGLVNDDFLSCDVNGSIPATLRETSIPDPVFGYNPATEKEETPYRPQVVDVMAVNNLPNELPREASEEFGDKLIEYVITEILKEESKIIERASIAKEGRLTLPFRYLTEYAAE